MRTASRHCEILDIPRDTGQENLAASVQGASVFEIDLSGMTDIQTTPERQPSKQAGQKKKTHERRKAKRKRGPKTAVDQMETMGADEKAKEGADEDESTRMDTSTSAESIDEPSSPQQNSVQKRVSTIERQMQSRREGAVENASPARKIARGSSTRIYEDRSWITQNGMSEMSQEGNDLHQQKAMQPPSVLQTMRRLVGMAKKAGSTCVMDCGENGNHRVIIPPPFPLIPPYLPSTFNGSPAVTFGNAERRVDHNDNEEHGESNGSRGHFANTARRVIESGTGVNSATTEANTEPMIVDSASRAEEWDFDYMGSGYSSDSSSSSLSESNLPESSPLEGQAYPGSSHTRMPLYWKGRRILDQVTPECLSSRTCTHRIRNKCTGRHDGRRGCCSTALQVPQTRDNFHPGISGGNQDRGRRGTHLGVVPRARYL